MHPFKGPANLSKSRGNSTLSAFVDIMIIFLARAQIFFYTVYSLHLKGKHFAYIHRTKKTAAGAVNSAALIISKELSVLLKEMKILFSRRCRASLIGDAAFLLHSQPLINQCWQGRSFVCHIQRDKCLPGSQAHLKRRRQPMPAD